MSDKRTIDFRYAPPSCWTAICRPDDPHKTLVREDGALLYNFALRSVYAWHFNRVVEFGILADHTPISATQRTETAAVPVVITTLRYKHATLELTTFAHQHNDGRRTDIVLWTVRVADEIDEALTGLRVDILDRDHIVTGMTLDRVNTLYTVPATDMPSIPTLRAMFQEGAAQPTRTDRAVVALASAPQPLEIAQSVGFRPASAFSVEPVVLRGGESLSGAIFLPQNHQDVADLTLDMARAALEQERAFWNDYCARLVPLSVPDDDLMDMVVACARNMMQARQIKQGRPVFQVGATIYNDMWVVDGHFMIECAHYLGFRDDAIGALGHLMTRVQPDGSITRISFHIKETGIALATLVRQCELLGDDERLRSYWPVIQHAVGYIEGLRAQAYALPPESPAHGLMPPTFSDGGASGERPEYTTAFWTLVGLKYVAGAAQRLGYAEDAARFSAAYESLLADVRRCAARDLQALPDGTPYLPQVIPGSGNHNLVVDYPGDAPRAQRIQPGTATWAFCQAIWPGEVFAPDDPLVTNLLALFDQLDDEQGIPAETGWYPYRSLWGYAASFEGHAWLYAGRPDKTVDYLYAFANHAAPTRVWREEQSLRSNYNGQFCGDMPHNWGSAEFIRMVRHLLVFERGDTLELLGGLPPEWRIAGREVRLDSTPTRFGPVSLRARFGENGGAEVRVTLTESWPIRAERVRLFAGRLGSGAVSVNGAPATIAADGTIELPLDSVITITIQ